LSNRCGKLPSMTTEEDFQRALDANPEDHNTRLVFADWLEERGDPRAAGYRALGTVRKRSIYLNAESIRNRWIFGTVTTRDQLKPYGDCMVAEGWFKAIKCGDRTSMWKYFFTRREAEDATALAFGKMTAGRRSELLAETEAGSRPDPPTKRPKRGRKK
jgi:uncharacterized protein (TIGR02996 family)